MFAHELQNVGYRLGQSLLVVILAEVVDLLDAAVVLIQALDVLEGNQGVFLRAEEEPRAADLPDQFVDIQLFEEIVFGFKLQSMIENANKSLKEDFGDVCLIVADVQRKLSQATEGTVVDSHLHHLWVFLQKEKTRHSPHRSPPQPHLDLGIKLPQMCHNHL